MQIPKNQIEFEQMFSTEEQCLEFIKKIRFPEGNQTVEDCFFKD